MEREIESTIIAGSMVHFVYVDPAGKKENDFEFDARCRFIPRVGELVKTGRGGLSFVKNVFHAFAQSDQFEEGKFFQSVTVALTTRPGLEESARLQ